MNYYAKKNACWTTKVLAHSDSDRPMLFSSGLLQRFVNEGIGYKHSIIFSYVL
jgi:hypothetical protein